MDDHWRLPKWWLKSFTWWLHLLWSGKITRNSESIEGTVLLFFFATELQICQSLSQSLFKKISVYASMLDGCWRSWIICTAETYHQLTALCWLCWIQSAMVTVCHSLPFGMDRIAMQFRIVRNCQDLVGIGWVHLSPGLRRGPSCQAIDPKYPDDSLYPRLILDLSLRLVGGLNMYWFSTG